MINRVIIVGRLTRDPELRTTPNGVNVITFSLAFDNKNRNADGSRSSSFITCTAWRQNADFISKYCKKGTQIGIEGSLQERRFQRRDGSNASVIEIQVDSVTLFGSKANGVPTQNNSFAPQSNQYNNTIDPLENDDDIFGDDGDLADDDLPFGND